MRGKTVEATSADSEYINYINNRFCRLGRGDVIIVAFDRDLSDLRYSLAWNVTKIAKRPLAGWQTGFSSIEKTKDNRQEAPIQK